MIDGFIADFYCHSQGLVLELDGGVHEERIEYDQERDRILTARGLNVLRISNDAVRDQLPEVLAQILEVCRKGSDPGNALLEPIPPPPFPKGKGE